MRTTRILLLAGALSSLPCTLAPAHAGEQRRSATARLTCGHAILTSTTQWLLSADNPSIWLQQSITLKRVGAREVTALALEGRQRKRISSHHSGLDAVVLSWACIQSTHGANYILLGYHCGADDAEKFCGGEREWFRLLNDKGGRVDAGFTRQDGRYDRLYEKLGVAAQMSEGVSMTSLLPDA